MKNFKQITKSFDIFGKQYNMNFDKSWDSHKTNYGGISTFIFAFFVIFYTSICFNIMIN